MFLDPRGVSVADGPEGHVAFGDKFFIRPFCSDLFPVISPQTRVAFQFFPVRIKQADRRSLGGADHHYIMLASGQDQVKHDKHDDGTFGQASRPGKDLEPFIVFYAPLDRFYMKRGKFIFCIFRKEKRDPFQYVRFQVSPVLIHFFSVLMDDGYIRHQGLEIIFPPA